MELYRPVSEAEFKEVEALKFSGFPRCEKTRPLFTALLSESGALDIAKRMKITPDQGSSVYLLRFLAEDSFIRQFPVQNADEPERQALWLNAEELDILNQHLIGKISVVGEFRSDPASRDTFFA